jgi:hypothetical protein
MRKPRLCILLLAPLLILLARGESAAQCALCAEALEASAGPESGLAAGFYWSILFLLGTLGLLASGLVAFIVYTVRRQNALESQEA